MPRRKHHPYYRAATALQDALLAFDATVPDAEIPEELQGPYARLLQLCDRLKDGRYRDPILAHCRPTAA